MPGAQPISMRDRIDPAEFSERLSGLPPSSKLVAKVLAHEAPLDSRELANETRLPSRTVRYGITRLKDKDLLDEEPKVTDPRKQVYSLPLASTDVPI